MYMVHSSKLISLSIMFKLGIIIIYIKISFKNRIFFYVNKKEVHKQEEGRKMSTSMWEAVGDRGGAEVSRFW